MATNGQKPKFKLEDSGLRSAEYAVVVRPEDRAAAAQRRATFPYRFPPEQRQLGDDIVSHTSDFIPSDERTHCVKVSPSSRS